MIVETRTVLLQLLEELGAVPGVRAALLSTTDGALTAADDASMPIETANDIAKTIRRMTVASATVGVPLQDLLINFGPARMMVVPVSEDATVVSLLERDTAVAPVRQVLATQLESLQALLAAEHESLDGEILDETEEEIERILRGELGQVLQRIQSQFHEYAVKAGHSSEETQGMIREQLREWLLCCNPSTYTFPLLVDGLGQLLNDAPAVRSSFMEQVQLTIRGAQ